MNKLILFIGFTYLLVAVTISSGNAEEVIKADKVVVVNAADDSATENVNTRLFTNDANTNNNIASGLLGIGLGVGGKVKSA